MERVAIAKSKPPLLFFFLLPTTGLVSVSSFACFLEICLMGQLVSGLLLVLPRFAHLLSCIMSCQSLLVPPACLDKICPVHEHTRDAGQATHDDDRWPRGTMGPKILNRHFLMQLNGQLDKKKPLIDPGSDSSLP